MSIPCTEDFEWKSSSEEIPKSQTQCDWASLKRLFLCGTDTCYLWGLCILQTVRRHGLSIQDELWIAEWPSLWRFGSHLWRLTTTVGKGLCDLSSRRIRWGLCVRDCVCLSLNTQPLQPDVQLSQQLELVYQIIVFIKLLVLFPQPFHFLAHVLTKLIITIWRLWLKTFPIYSILFLQSLCLLPAYPITRYLCSVYVSFHHDDYVSVLLCIHLSTYSAAYISSLSKFLKLNFLSDKFIKIAYSPPSSRYNTLSIGTRAGTPLFDVILV